MVCFLIPKLHTAQCDLQVSNATPCGGELVGMAVTNPGAGTYTWDWTGDGLADTTGISFDFPTPSFEVDSTLQIEVFEDGVSCGTTSIMVLAAPDATIGVPPGLFAMVGNEIKACNGSNSIDLEIFNNSATYADNASYEINWGDGSAIETFDNTTFSNISTISHTYIGLGYYNITVTVTHQNGCVTTNDYSFYNGGNPSVGLVIPGNTVGLCAPATLDFPITNTALNPPGTEYTFYVNGEEVVSYTQDDLPPTFTYTFEESSCDNVTSTGNYVNAFDLYVVASNPCNSSTATIEPIEVSAPPSPEFSIAPPPSACPGSTFEFENTTPDVTEVVSGNPSNCIDVLNPNWSISGTPGVDWILESGSLFGSQTIEIQFLNPGEYTIEMIVISFACGEFTFSQTITIAEPPIVEGGALIFDPGAGIGCAPVEIPFTNNSQGIDTFAWNIYPPIGWSFAGGTNANSQEPVINFEQGGSFDVSLFAANACQEVSWDTTLIIPGNPNILLDPLPDSCYAATLNFPGQNGITFDANADSLLSYYWEFPGASNITSSTEAFPGTVIYDTPGTYIVTVGAANNCGTSELTDTFVVQEPVPLVLPDPATFCANEDPVFLAASPTGGTWSGTGVNANGLFGPAFGQIGTNTLTYSFGIGACNVESTVDMTINPLPNVEAGPDLTACLNEPTIPLSPNPLGGAWSTNNPNILNNDQVDPQAAAPGQYALYYDFTDTNGCSNQDSLLVLINDLPTVLVPDTSYCDSPGQVVLPVPAPLGGSFSGPGLVGSQFFDPAQAGGVGLYDLTYSFTDANGCSETATFTVDVLAPPAIEAGPNDTLCINNGLLQLPNVVPATGGTWTGNGIANESEAIFDPILAGGGNHVLLYEFGEGLCEVQDSVAIFVVDVTNTTAGPDDALCQNADPITLTGYNPLGGEWVGPGINDPAVGSFDPALTGAGTFTLEYVFVDDASGCTFSNEKEVVVHPLPQPDFSVPNFACINELVEPINQSLDATSFQWSFGNGSSSQETWPQTSYPDTGMFLIQLQAANQFGCVDLVADSIFIAAPPNADFLPDQDEGCAFLDVQFENLSSGYQPTYNWNFGNGTTTSTPEPTALQNYPPGVFDTTYVVTLEAFNQCGTDLHMDTIYVQPLPTANFGVEVDTGCAPLFVSFNNVTLGSATEFYWDFGNGSTSTDSLPEVQEFAADTTLTNYQIMLIATNNCGQDTAYQQLTVEPEDVSAFFNASNTIGCPPFSVDFTSFATFGTNISWDFGDGNTISEDNPTFTFAETGDYTVTQYVSNICGSDSISMQITVLPVPTVDFTIPPINCNEQQVQFQNTSTPLAGSEWTFGNGEGSTLTSPLFSYDAPGTYTVTLIGYDASTGCPASTSQELTIYETPTAGIDIDVSDGCIPLEVQFSSTSQGASYYAWDFGDNNTSIAASPNHTYLEDGGYTASLAVTSQDGCSDTITFANILAYPLPEALFSWEKDSECGLPVSVSFFNESSGAQGYVWDLGEGTQTNLVSPELMYEDPGTLTTSLVATNQFGCTDTVSQDIDFYPQPIAEIGLEPIAGCEPLTIRPVSNSYDATNYYWSFGDGAVSEVVNPEHTYSEAGNYDITLVASYDDVCLDTLTVSDLVQVLESPVASFSWILDPSGEPSGTMQFINESMEAATSFWDFGDGTTSEERNPIHRYYEGSARQVILDVTATNGCTDDTLAIIIPPLFGQLYVPNAFTPGQSGGDAQIFLPKGIGLREYRLQIFSTYGQLIWQSTELKEGQPAIGWDGTYNGNPLPQDTYVWKIWAVFEDGREWIGNPIEGGRYKRMGSLVLLR